jgi:glycosyltransferase involved in cell wall biosynthesis
MFDVIRHETAHRNEGIEKKYITKYENHFYMKLINKRICLVLVVDDLGYGGAERQVVELANSMDCNRFDVHVCSLSDHVPLGNELIDSGHRLHIVKAMGRYDFTVVPRLAYLLRKLKADIVHGYLFTAEIVCRLAGRLAGTKLVVGSERNADRAIRKRHILGLKLTHRSVDIIVANSNAGVESNRKIFGRRVSDYRVIHNGVDTNRFKPMNGTTVRQRLQLPLQCPVIGVFANFKKQKNHAMLFRAFKLVLEDLPEARLLLVGDKIFSNKSKSNSYKAQLDRFIDDIMIRDQCVFLGHQKNTEFLYPTCDITALSSIHEGTSNALLESMACGVPVIATNVGDNKYIIKEGEVGYLVMIDDEVEMAYRMKSLLSNNALRKEMGRKARDWVQAKFSNKQLAKKMEAVYMEFLSGRDK